MRSGHQDDALPASDLPAAAQHHRAFGADGGRVEPAIDAARNDREFLARHLMARRHAVGDEMRRHDHAIAGIERARIGFVARRIVQIGRGIAVHDPHAVALLQRRGAARRPDAERVDQVDPLGQHQIGERARVARRGQRIGTVGDEAHPFAAEPLQFAVERAVFGRDDHARAGAQQRHRDVDRRARRRRFDQSGEDLQHRCARQPAHRGSAASGFHYRHDGPLALRRALRRNTVRRKTALDAE